MCGRLTQYRGIHDFVEALAFPNPLINNTREQPFERYNAAPSTQLALFHQEGELLRADMVRWGWRPHWAKDRAAPINARVEKVAHGPFFRAIWPHRAIIAIDNWFEWELRDSCNPNHLVASGWIAAPAEVTLEEAQAAKLFYAAGAWHQVKVAA